MNAMPLTRPAENRSAVVIPRDCSGNTCWLQVPEFLGCGGSLRVNVEHRLKTEIVLKYSQGTYKIRLLERALQHPVVVVLVLIGYLEDSLFRLRRLLREMQPLHILQRDLNR